MFGSTERGGTQQKHERVATPRALDPLSKFWAAGHSRCGVRRAESNERGREVERSRAKGTHPSLPSPFPPSSLSVSLSVSLCLPLCLSVSLCQFLRERSHTHARAHCRCQVHSNENHAGLKVRLADPGRAPLDSRNDDCTPPKLVAPCVCACVCVKL